MRYVYKIANIALIFTLIGAMLCQNIAYALPDSLNLRPLLRGSKRAGETIELVNSILSKQSQKSSQNGSPSISIEDILRFYKETGSIEASPVIKKYGHQTDIYIFKNWNLVIKTPMSIVKTITYFLFDASEHFKHKKEIKSLGLALAVALIDIGTPTKKSPHITRNKLGGLAAPFASVNGTIWQQMVIPYEERLRQLCHEEKTGEAKALIGKLVELNRSIWKRGVFVKDTVYKNIGIDNNGDVVLIDVGRVQDKKPPLWKIKLYLAFMKSKELSFLAEFNKELSQYYKELTSRQWTAKDINKLWGTEEGRELDFVLDVRLRKFLIKSVASSEETKVKVKKRLHVKQKGGKKQSIWNLFEKWFFGGVEKAYAEGMLSERGFRKKMAIKESKAMKVYAQTVLAQALMEIVILLGQFALVGLFGFTGKLDLGTGYFALWFPSMILRVAPIIYFWWRNPRVKFVLAFILGVLFPPGAGFAIIPLQAIFTFRSVFHFKVKALTSRIFEKNKLSIPAAFIEPIDPVSMAPAKESQLSVILKTIIPLSTIEPIDPAGKDL